MFRGRRDKGPKTEGIVIHWASRYELVTSVLFLGREAAFREATLDLADLRSDSAVLDVGCGPGTLTLAAKRRAGEGRVCGIDPAAEMVALARQKARQSLLDVSFEVGTIEELPFDDATFDVVLSSLMLHHLPPALQRRGLAEVYRVLKPGGSCLVVDFEIHGHGALARLRGHIMRAHGKSDGESGVGASMRDQGFEVETGPTIHRLIRFARGVKPE